MSHEQIKLILLSYLRTKHERQCRQGAQEHAGGDHPERHVHLVHGEESIDDDPEDRHNHDVIDADTDLLRIVQSLDSHFARLPRKEDAENEEHRYVKEMGYENQYPNRDCQRGARSLSSLVG